MGRDSPGPSIASLQAPCRPLVRRLLPYTLAYSVQYAVSVPTTFPYILAHKKRRVGAGGVLRYNGAKCGRIKFQGSPPLEFSVISCRFPTYLLTHGYLMVER